MQKKKKAFFFSFFLLFFFFLFGCRLSTEEGKEKPSRSLLLHCSSNLHHHQSRQLLLCHVCVHDIYLLVIIMFSVLRCWVINPSSVWHLIIVILAMPRHWRCYSDVPFSCEGALCEQHNVCFTAAEQTSLSRVPGLQNSRKYKSKEKKKSSS